MQKNGNIQWVLFLILISTLSIPTWAVIRPNLTAESAPFENLCVVLTSLKNIEDKVIKLYDTYKMPLETDDPEIFNLNNKIEISVRKLKKIESSRQNAFGSLALTSVLSLSFYTCQNFNFFYNVGSRDNEEFPLPKTILEIGSTTGIISLFAFPLLLTCYKKFKDQDALYLSVQTEYDSVQSQKQALIINAGKHRLLILKDFIENLVKDTNDFAWSDPIFASRLNKEASELRDKLRLLKESYYLLDSSAKLEDPSSYPVSVTEKKPVVYSVILFDQKFKDILQTIESLKDKIVSQ